MKAVLFFIFTSSFLEGQSQIITTVDSIMCYDINAMAYDKKSGNLYFVSGLGNKILSMDSNYVTHIIAGTGASGFWGDGGPATNAKINTPGGIAVDTNGNLYFADSYNQRIRKIEVSTGLISTIVGSGAVGVSAGGFSGDGSPATAAQLNVPTGVALDNFGNLYMADGQNYRIRKVDPTGIINTVVGNGLQGLTAGDGGPATAAQCYPVIVITDNSGNLFFTQPLSTIRKVNSSGIISTIAGDTISHIYNGDDIPATSAYIDPYCIAISDDNLIYISDASVNNRIRMIDASGIIHTIAGNGTSGFSGDGGPATAAEIYGPSGIAFDRCRNLFVGQVNSPRIRKVSFNPSCAPLKTSEISATELTIYPNPATSKLNINGLTAETNYVLFNVLGIIEQSGTLKEGNNTITIKSLPPCLHILELIDDEGKKTVKKIVKE